MGAGEICREEAEAFVLMRFYRGTEDTSVQGGMLPARVE